MADYKNMRELMRVGARPVGPTGYGAVEKWINQRAEIIDQGTGENILSRDQVAQIAGAIAAGSHGRQLRGGGNGAEWERKYVASPVFLLGEGQDRVAWVATDESKRGKGSMDYDAEDPGGTYNYDINYTPIAVPDLVFIEKERKAALARQRQLEIKRLQDEAKERADQAALDKLKEQYDPVTPPATTPPATPPPPPAQGGGVSLDPARGYELYAVLAGQGTTFEAGARGGTATSWNLLESPGDNAQGYKLCGQALALAAQKFPGQTPAQQGVPAWVFAQSTNGPALVPASVLRALGVRA